MARLFEESFLRKLERLALLSRRAVAGQTQGEQRSPKRGQSVEFSDFRPYTPGDDIRRIDWNAYARLERFFIKLFVEEEDRTVHLLLDSSRSMNWGKPNKLEYAARIAGALGYIALLGLDRITVVPLAGGNNNRLEALPPMRGRRSALNLFEYLQRITSREIPPNHENPPGLVKSYSNSARNPGPALLVSDLMDEGWKDSVNRLAGRGFDVTLVHLLSPDENDPGRLADPPLTGDFRLLDSENNQEVELTADFEILDSYKSQLAAWQEDWRKFCAARNIHYIPWDSSQSLEDLLFAGLRNQGVLR